MKRPRWCRFVSPLAWLVLTIPCFSAEDDWDEDEEWVQLPFGLSATYQAPDGKPLVTRMEPVPRLFGDAGGSAHPRVSADGFQVTWKGRLLVPYDGNYTFWLDRCSLGDLKFTLYGDPVRPGEPVELEFGNVPLEISGVQRGNRGEFQLAWQNERFDREIIHPRFFGHAPKTGVTPGVVEQALEDSGAALAESFGCFRCHQGPEAWIGSLAADIEPAVLLPGPRLSATAQRVHRAWLTNYLTDPPANRPGTRMPGQFVDGSGMDKAALETIVAFLGSGQSADVAAAKADGSVEKGKELFDAAGCAACHAPPEGSIVERGVPLRIPLLDRLAEKWTVSGLAAFLQTPLNSRPHGRMPDFALADGDARDLVAYLLQREGAGKAPRFVELPRPKQPVEAEPQSLVDPDDCLVLLGLDEASGKLTDESGNDHHGRVSGKLVYGRPGHDGGALGFDGQGGHVVIEGSAKFDTHRDFTWSAWINTTKDGSIMARCREQGGWVQGGKTLFVRGGKLSFDVGWVSAVTSKTPVADGTWHQVAVTAKFNAQGVNDTVTLYIDGKPDVVKDDWDIEKYAEGNDFVLKIGWTSTSFPQSRSFDGLIDGVSAWSRVLDESELATAGQGESHLAQTEAALFTPEQLKVQWIALGEDPAAFDEMKPGMRLRAVALRYMAAKGCIDCHEAPGQASLGGQRTANGGPELDVATQPAAAGPLGNLPAGRLGSGCLATGSSRGKAPQFDFSEDERSALSAYVRSLGVRTSPSLAESLALEMKLLNCVACHDDEGYGGEPLTALLGGQQEAQFILPPSLTGVAERMLPERLDEYLRDGTRFRRLRPWIGARMPGFGVRGGRLAQNLCVRDGASLPPPPGNQPKVDNTAVPQSQIELGRLLVSSKGLTCMNCHAMNGQQPSGEVDPTTRSPDLALATGHIRPDYFRRLLRDPERIFPGTKMPMIIPRDEPAPVPALAELPTEMLIQSLWSYMSLGEQAPTPLDEDPTQALPNLLRVYVQRGPTFAGKQLFGRGISCGFPTGTLLFDADTLEPGAIWTEGFLTRVPTNYFGLNWRVPGKHELLNDGQHSLAYQAAEGRPWEIAPRPLDSDPNTGSRFDGYTIGRTEIALRYRLLLGGRQVPVSDTLRVDHRDAWYGFVRKLAIAGLPGGSRIAPTLPNGERHEFFSAAGEKVEQPGNVQQAPLVVYRSGREVHAIRVEAPPGSTWLVEEGVVRVVSPAVTSSKPVSFRIDRWTYNAPDAQPTAEELASLCDPALLEPEPLPEVVADAKPAEKPEEKPEEKTEPAAVAASPVSAESEEPFSYKFDAIPAPPQGWRPSGSAFTADGMIYACGLTEGRVYRTKVPPVPVPEDFRWQLYATGLNVSTGMNAIGNRVFVAHRPETTELIDADGDGTVETFRTVTGPWSLKDGFHEYNFGLAVDPDNHMFSAMNNGYFWSYGGPTNRGRFRSSVLRYTVDGRTEEWGRGCRVPNTITCGPDGQAFFVDNQGDWIQVCKLVHCRKGLFYGHPETEDEFLPEGEVPDGLPAIWIPYTVVRSAAALCYDDTGGRFGPFTGQMFTGDCGYGQSVNIMRMALEQVDGVYQGAAFRFIDGPPRGPEHAAFGPDGHMYISCLTDGLIRLRYGGKVPMEIHHVDLRRDNRGFVLHFTRPVHPDAEVTPQTIRARRWYYPYGIRYGSPRFEEVDVPIEQAELSADRRSIDVTLPIKTYKNCMVYYFNVGKLPSADGEPVEHPEAWYTIQRLWK